MKVIKRRARWNPNAVSLHHAKLLVALWHPAGPLILGARFVGSMKNEPQLDVSCPSGSLCWGPCQAGQDVLL